MNEALDQDLPSIINDLKSRYDYFCIKMLPTLQQFGTKRSYGKSDWRKVIFMRQYLWEKLHSVNWYQTPEVYRLLFGYVVYILVENSNQIDSNTFCSLDVGILLSSGNSHKLLLSLVEKHSLKLPPIAPNNDIIDAVPPQPVKMPKPGSHSIAVPRIECLDTVKFYEDFLMKGMPVVITGMTKDWGAMERWRDINYLLQGKAVPLLLL